MAIRSGVTKIESGKKWRIRAANGTTRFKTYRREAIDAFVLREGDVVQQEMVMITTYWEDEEKDG